MAGKELRHLMVEIKSKGGAKLYQDLENIDSKVSDGINVNLTKTNQKLNTIGKTIRRRIKEFEALKKLSKGDIGIKTGSTAAQTKGIAAMAKAMDRLGGSMDKLVDISDHMNDMLIQIAGESADAADGIFEYGEEAKKARKKVKGFTKANGKLGNEFKHTNRQGRGQAKTFSALASGGGGLIGVYASIAANVFILDSAFRALSESANLTRLEENIASLGNGRNLRGLAAELREISAAALSVDESLRLAASSTAFGFDDTTIKKFTKQAKQASIALGIEFSDALSRLTRGVAKQEVELLDELGIVTRLEPAMKKYAAAAQKTVEQLTDLERRTALAVEASRQLEAAFGDINVTSTEYERIMGNLSTITRATGKAFSGALEPAVGWLNGFLGPLAKQLGTIGKVEGAISGLEAAMRSMDMIADTTNDYGVNVKDTIRQVTAYQEAGAALNDLSVETAKLGAEMDQASIYAKTMSLTLSSLSIIAPNLEYVDKYFGLGRIKSNIKELEVEAAKLAKIRLKMAITEGGGTIDFTTGLVGNSTEDIVQQKLNAAELREQLKKALKDKKELDEELSKAKAAESFGDVVRNSFSFYGVGESSELYKTVGRIKELSNEAEIEIAGLQAAVATLPDSFEGLLSVTELVAFNAMLPEAQAKLNKFGMVARAGLVPFNEELGLAQSMLSSYNATVKQLGNSELADQLQATLVAAINKEFGIGIKTLDEYNSRVSKLSKTFKEYDNNVLDAENLNWQLDKSVTIREKFNLVTEKMYDAAGAGKQAEMEKLALQARSLGYQELAAKRAENIARITKEQTNLLTIQSSAAKLSGASQADILDKRLKTHQKITELTSKDLSVTQKIAATQKAAVLDEELRAARIRERRASKDEQLSNDLAIATAQTVFAEAQSDNMLEQVKFLTEKNAQAQEYGTTLEKEKALNALNLAKQNRSVQLAREALQLAEARIAGEQALASLNRTTTGRPESEQLTAERKEAERKYALSQFGTDLVAQEALNQAVINAKRKEEIQLIKEKLQLTRTDKDGEQVASAAVTQAFGRQDLADRAANEALDNTEAVMQAGVDGAQNAMTTLASMDTAVGSIGMGFYNLGQIMNQSMENGAMSMAGVAAAAQAVSGILSGVSQQAVSEIDHQIAMEKKRDGKSAESVEKLRKLEQKKLKEQQKSKLQQAVMATATGMAEALTLGPILGPIMAGVVGAMGLMQINAIKSQGKNASALASVGSTPQSIEFGSRSNTVDVGQSATAGERAFVAGQAGTGTNANNFMGAASGANIQSGTAVNVGERGAEVFIPDVPGTVVPSGDIKQGSSKPSLNIVVNNDNLDAQSMIDRSDDLMEAIEVAIRAKYGTSLENL